MKLTTPLPVPRKIPCVPAAYSRQSSAYQRGFTLIEILVSIIILSLGILGMVGMQAFALQSNREAKLQSIATRYGGELAEMMRGNNQVASTRSSSTNPYLDTNTAVSSSVSSCLSTTCTPQQLAAWQMQDWLKRVEGDSGLPGAKVEVCFSDSPYDEDGKPQWSTNCDNSGNNLYIKIGWDTTKMNDDSSGTKVTQTAAGRGPGVIIPLGFE